MPFQPEHLSLDNAKRMGKRLRKALSTAGANLSHHETLDVLAKAFGFDHWQAAQVSLGSQVAPSPVLTPSVTAFSGPVLALPVTGNTPVSVALKLAIKPSVVIRTLFLYGVMATVNQSVEQSVAAVVVRELGFTPVDERTGDPLIFGDPEDAAFCPSFSRWWKHAGHQLFPGQSLPDFDADRCVYLDPHVQATFQGFVQGHRQARSEMMPMWDQTFRAFRGAFDTPLSWRRQDDDYAVDARRRVNAFNVFVSPDSQPGLDPSPVTSLSRSRHPRAAP